MNTVEPKKGFMYFFEVFSDRTIRFAGSSFSFLTAISLVVIWIVSGPIFHFSDTWQLVINTGTSVITFLMVFLIQKAQNKDYLSLQLKLNELIAATAKANNKIMDIEALTEEEMLLVKQKYTEMATSAIEKSA